jgi:outer membrane protein TolC
MINALIALIHKIASALEAAVEREEKKAEAAFQKAKEALEKATGHRKTAATGAKTAAALKDLVTIYPQPPLPDGDPTMVPAQYADNFKK